MCDSIATDHAERRGNILKTDMPKKWFQDICEEANNTAMRSSPVIRCIDMSEWDADDDNDYDADEDEKVFEEEFEQQEEDIRLHEEQQRAQRLAEFKREQHERDKLRQKCKRTAAIAGFHTSNSSNKKQLPEDL